MLSDTWSPNGPSFDWKRLTYRQDKIDQDSFHPQNPQGPSNGRVEKPCIISRGVKFKGPQSSHF